MEFGLFSKCRRRVNCLSAGCVELLYVFMQIFLRPRATVVAFGKLSVSVTNSCFISPVSIPSCTYKTQQEEDIVSNIDRILQDHISGFQTVISAYICPHRGKAPDLDNGVHSDSRLHCAAVYR